MEIMVNTMPQDFNFDSTNTSPFSSAPASPRGFDKYYFSAPTSPTNTTFFRQISFSFAPQHHQQDDDDDDNDMKGFTFTSLQDLPTLSSADELFVGGKIKVVEPTIVSPKKILKTTVSFGRNNKVCYEQTVSDQNSKDLLESDTSSSSFSWLHKTWNLKELLFRNASEGHERNNKKYDFLRIFHKNEELKESRVHISKESNIRVSNAKKKNRVVAAPPLTAHERHYKMKRAAAEEMRKKTYLPYNQKLMMGSCIGIDAAAVRDPSRPLITPRRP